jgi:organic radical activating enzyme
MIKLNESLGENFCIAPWVNLHIHTTGAIKPCCGGNENFGLAQDGDWSYINGTSKRLSQLKHSLVSNEKVFYCQGCHEKPWYSELLNQNLSVENIEDFVLKTIDLRWGTTCQLSCLYCGSTNSSTWQKLESQQKVVPIQPSRKYKNSFDQLFLFLEKNSDQITRFSLLGGEPLLLKENYRLLDIMPASAHVEIFTNLNTDLESNLLYEKLVGRSNVNWYISMENIGDRFEFVRRGADWKTQVKNIKKIKQDTEHLPGHALSLQSQFCVYSALNLTEIYDHFGPENIHINWAILDHPKVLNFMYFPRLLKEMCLKDIDIIMADNDTMISLKNIKNELIIKLDLEQENIIQMCRDWHQELKQSYFAEYPIDFDQLWPVYHKFQQNSP